MIDALSRRLPDWTSQVSGQLTSVVNELKSIAKHPRSAGAYLESRSPWLNRKFLGVASNLIEPFLIGMGLNVRAIREDAVEVLLPGVWRNQGENGEVHSAAVTAAGEFASRLFWEHHLDLRRSELRVERTETRFLQVPRGDLTVVFRCSVADREETLLRLRADGHARHDGSASVYDRGERLCAEIEISWVFERGIALSAGPSSK